MPNSSKQSDDQELAKVLAGVDQQLNNASVDLDSALNFEETAGPVDTSATPFAIPTPPSETITPPAPTPDPVVTPEPTPTPTPASSPSDAGDLESIKKTALEELRPLVDKLDVSPEEKFDTYLLLLRSTDDKDLIAPAHDAATAIEDEARRAQALLDIVKEIDYLTNKAA